MPPGIQPHTLLTFIVQLALLLTAARSLGEVFRRLGQPPVIGELSAGVLLGPSVLGLLAPDLRLALFPRDPLQFQLLEVIADAQRVGEAQEEVVDQQAEDHRAEEQAAVDQEQLRMLGEAGHQEEEVRDLWRLYFQTIAIRERTNPRCQKNFMPSRYPFNMLSHIFFNPNFAIVVKNMTV